MKKITIFFKSNSNSLSMVASPEDVESIFTDIIQARKNKEINTLIIEGKMGKAFIDPHEVASCEITSPRAS